MKFRNATKNLLAGAIMAFGMVAGANANTVVLGDVWSSASFNDILMAGPFQDFFQFNAAGPNQGIAFSVVSANYGNLIGLGSLSTALYAGQIDSVAGHSALVSGTDFSRALMLPGFTASASAGSMAGPAGGWYTLLISGSAHSNGGAMGGAIILAPSGSPQEVSAVPEPEQWALMLAGLGLTGYMVRRRKI